MMSKYVISYHQVPSGTWGSCKDLKPRLLCGKARSLPYHFDLLKTCYVTKVTRELQRGVSELWQFFPLLFSLSPPYPLYVVLIIYYLPISCV